MKDYFSSPLQSLSLELKKWNFNGHVYSSQCTKPIMVLCSLETTKVYKVKVVHVFIYYCYWTLVGFLNPYSSYSQCQILLSF